MQTHLETPVRESMSKPAMVVAPTDSLAEAYQRLLDSGISSLAVVEGGTLVGVVSRTDLLRAGRRSNTTVRHSGDARHVILEFPKNSVGEIMTRDVFTVTGDTSIASASKSMSENHVHRVFVQDGTSLLGVFSTLDIIRALKDQPAKEPISEFMTAPITVVDVEQTVAAAVDKLETSRVTGLIVVENEWPVGVFTQVEALAARELAEGTLVEEAMDPALICMPVSTRMHRAAQQALRMRVRRIVASENRHMRGILSGLDFAKYAARGA